MARTDKDNNFKADALKYCVATGRIPYLEVQVSSAIDLTADEKLITDVDVLGLSLLPDGLVRRLLVDCKSTAKMSPISRAFWLSGVMTYSGADEGFVLLGKEAEKAHRLSAQAIKVNLFDKTAFHAYATASNPEFVLLKAYGSQLGAWHSYLEFYQTNAVFTKLGRYLTSEIPLATDPSKRFRKLLSAVREAKGELDPSKSAHMAIFAEIVLAACVLFVPMIGNLRHLVQLSETKNDYESVLRFYIWGGRDGYTMLQKMNEAKGNQDMVDFENQLMAWPQFLETTRGFLDAPTLLHGCGPALRELTLRFHAQPEPQADNRLGLLLAAPRIRQFTNRISYYMASACRLPTDFPKTLSATIDAIIGE